MNPVLRAAHVIALELHVLDVREVLALPYSQMVQWLHILKERNEAMMPSKKSAPGKIQSPRSRPGWSTNAREIENAFAQRFGGN